MTASPNRMTVRGSERVSVPGAHGVGPVPNDERFEVTVRVRRKTSVQNLAADGSRTDQLPSTRRHTGR